MKYRTFLIALLLTSPAFAQTAPTPPSTVDFRVAPALCIFTVADSTALNSYLNGKAGAGCKGATGVRFGDKAILTAGVTYTGNFLLPVPTGALANGPNENYVTFESSNIGSLPAEGTRVALSDASNMPTLVAPAGVGFNLALKTVNGAHHYRFVGIKWTTPSNPSSAGGAPYTVSVLAIITPVAGSYRTTANYPHHISFERNIVQPPYDYAPNKCFIVSAIHFRLTDSYFTDCFDSYGGNGDSNALALGIGGGAGPYHIYNNVFEGMGEVVFIGGEVQLSPFISKGYEFEGAQNVTFRRNVVRRKLSYNKKHASYLQPTTVPGTGTISSSGTTVTFSTSQNFNMAAFGSIGLFIKNVASGQVVKIVSGSGTSWVSSPALSPAASGASWRTHVTFMGGKGIMETKGARRILIDSNKFENGWMDGQLGGGMVFSNREAGALLDIQLTNNWFLNCGETNVSIADGQAQRTSPKATSRLLIKNNLFENQNSAIATSIAAGREVVLALATNTYPLGWVSAANVKVAAATGTNVLVSSDGGGWGYLFDPVSQGNGVSQGAWNVSPDIPSEIWYSGGGKMILKTYINGKTARGDIYETFAAQALAANGGDVGYKWYLAQPQVAGSRYVADSWVIEHNTFAGSDSQYKTAIQVDTWSGVGMPDDPPAKATHFVIRNNIMFLGTPRVPAQNGIYGIKPGHKTGTDQVWPTFIDDATSVFDKNVFFGVNAETQKANYTHTPAFDAGSSPTGSAHRIGFHTPDQTGSRNGGEIGFTDYAGGNFLLKNGSQYKGWATDGADPGVNFTTFPNMSNVAAGTTADDVGGGGGGGGGEAPRR